MPDRPLLCTLLSRALVAHTIELDNEFERRLAQSGENARVTSVVMWSNFLRFVGDEITVGDLVAATALPKARVLSNIGGMERWRYVSVGPKSRTGQETAKRDGSGSGRGLRDDWLVRPTGAGRVGQEAWPSLFGEVEQRWTARFGSNEVRDLRDALASLVRRLDVELPEYLPIVASTDGFVTGFSPRPRTGTATGELGVLLAQVLLAYTLEFERDSELALPLSENVVRVLGADGLQVREVPGAAGISKEATSASFTSLVKSGHATVEGSTAATKVARLSASGEAARRRTSDLHHGVEAAWAERFGNDDVRRLTGTLERILESPALADGMRPDPNGWRASKPYRARTEALLADPLSALPHYPMVLHRGGWPDGS